MTNNIKIFSTLIAVAFILIIGIVMRYTTAADVTTTAEITNTAPVVDTIRIATSAYGTDTLTSGGILPTIGSDRTIHINGQITDLNGETDIASSTLSLVFHKTISTNTCTADKNDCYRITTCATDYTTGDDTQVSYNCEVPLAYWIDATDAASDYASDTWTSYITVSDLTASQGTLSATIEVNSLLALNIPTVIDYSTRSLGEQSSSTTNVETILSQRGNTKADVELSGTDMSCTLLGTIPVVAQKWSLTDVGYTSGTALTTSAASVARNLDLRTDDVNELTANLYWNIAIPATGVKGICSGSNTIAIIAQSVAVSVLNNATWANTGSVLPSALASAQIATIGDYVYLFGGDSSGTLTGVIYRAPVTNPTAWTNTGASLPSTLVHSQVAIIGDYVYLFGGYNGGSWTGAIYRASVTNPTTWTNTGASLPSALAFSQVVTIGDYVYLFGGYNGSWTGAIYRAPVTNPTTWTNTGASLPSALAYSQAEIIGDYVYLFGGRSSNTTYMNTIYRAPITDPTTWTNTGATLPSVLSLSQSAIVGDYVYLFGGYSGGYTNIIYSAPLANPTVWTNTSLTIPASLGYAHTATIGNYMYFFGGYNGSYSSAIYRALIE